MNGSMLGIARKGLWETSILEVEEPGLRGFSEAQTEALVRPALREDIANVTGYGALRPRRGVKVVYVQLFFFL